MTCIQIGLIQGNFDGRIQLRPSDTDGELFLGGDELFRTNGWTQVLIGQGVVPEHYQPIVDNMADDEFKAYMKGFRDHVNKSLDLLPNHEEFIARYCAMRSESPMPA